MGAVKITSKIELERAAHEANKQRVRAERDRLLRESDKAVLPDFPTTKASAWKTYRQELRDLTSQDGFPDAVQWPAPPGE